MIPRGAAALASALVSAVLTAGVTTAVADETRLRTVEFRPDLVLAVTAFVGYHIHFEFAPDEHFVTLASGDTASLEIAAEGNHLMLKPRRATPETNLTVLTSQRTYFLDYRALARAPQADEAVFSIRFTYPPDPRATVASPADAAGTRLGVPPAVRNRDYWYCGDPALRPRSAEDDGIQLRLSFGPAVELPAIYAAAADGTESLVNSHVENDTVVVHRIADRFVLRRGALVGCVLNRAAPGAARRAGSGTVRGDVARATRTVEP